ncbi:hypothetical protein ACIGO8_25750 [Streptomyces sp. NPDC053493]|uniref:hypothetical protein n=1 Tax=Streptomyces sp. NPDC053493 TaxID=3365705 RepID=UPI0037D2A36D
MPAPSPTDTAAGRAAADRATDLAAAETVTAFVVPPAAARAGRGPGRATGRRRAPEPAGPQDAASDVVRWAAFCCVLVPVVLLVYGTSVGGAAGAALGLAAVTTACRVLLRRSERGLRAEQRAEQRAGSRDGRGGPQGPDHSRS